MRKFQKTTLKYLIEKFDRYKIINNINTMLENIDYIPLDLKLSSIDIIKYEINNQELKHIEIEINHNNSLIILSRKE